MWHREESHIHPTTARCTFFTSEQGMLSGVSHMLSLQTSPKYTSILDSLIEIMKSEEQKNNKEE